MRMSRRATWVLVLIALLTGIWSPTAEADSVEDFYRGKSINLVIGYAAGGGYDQYARLLARYMGQNLPGKPIIVPRNMPGAGSLNAINNIYNVAPRDGTSIATFGPEVAFEPLRGGEGVQFDTIQFNWIGSMNRQVGLAVMSANSKIQTILDARAKEVTVGASGSGASSTRPSPSARMAIRKWTTISSSPNGQNISSSMERSVR
jgi:tripartite-type tricarboxylate transporter receptor subunit TctC